MMLWVEMQERRGEIEGDVNHHSPSTKTLSSHDLSRGVVPICSKIYSGKSAQATLDHLAEVKRTKLVVCCPNVMQSRAA